MASGSTPCRGGEGEKALLDPEDPDRPTDRKKFEGWSLLSPGIPVQWEYDLSVQLGGGVQNKKAATRVNSRKFTICG